MRVLVTRSLPDTPATVQDLAARGIDAVPTPLFDAVSLTPDIPDRPYQAAIFTSRHAARHYRATYTAPRIPAFCVGNQTASLLYGSNFSEIHSADGDRHALLRMIRTMAPDTRRPLLRLHGVKEHDPLAEHLAADGYQVTAISLYQMEPDDTRDQAMIEALCTGKAEGICFYSPRTASYFNTLIHKENLAEACRPLIAWCISGTTRAALLGSSPRGSLPFRSVAVAAHPTHRHLISLIAETHSD